jgi:hypothetical protein
MQYRSPLLGEQRRRSGSLPGGGSGGSVYYGTPAPRPPRAQRLASLLLLLAITVGALAAQKVLICDVDAEDAAIREAALVASMKRLQGTLASRSAQGGASFSAFQARTGEGLLRARRRSERGWARCRT